VRVTVPIGFDADAEARATGEATGLARLVVPQVDRLLFNNAPARIGEFSQVR
jgi:hypothetical protein